MYVCALLNAINQLVGLLGRGDQPDERPLPTHRTTQIWNKRTQIPMPRVGFEPTTPVFDRAKTIYALDRAATVVGRKSPLCTINCGRICINLFLSL
jgi:hypothetical protein